MNFEESSWMPFSTATVSTAPIYTTTIGTSFAELSTKEDVEKAMEKVDKHVDELEEDIEFLNKERQEMQNKLIYQETVINELNAKVNDLEKLCNILKSVSDYLTNRVEELNGN